MSLVKLSKDGRDILADADSPLEKRLLAEGFVYGEAPEFIPGGQGDAMPSLKATSGAQDAALRASADAAQKKANDDAAAEAKAEAIVAKATKKAEADAAAAKPKA